MAGGANMSDATVDWQGDEFLADVESAIVDGLESGGAVLVAETRRLLNLRGSSKSAGGRPSPPGEPPALKTQALFNSIEQEVQGSNRSVFVGVRSDSPAVNYALIHEFGGVIGGSDGSGVTHMPARPYLRPAFAKAKPEINRVFGAAFRRRLQQKGWIE
jgi:phage gpG-like protein